MGGIGNGSACKIGLGSGAGGSGRDCDEGAGIEGSVIKLTLIAAGDAAEGGGCACGKDWLQASKPKKAEQTNKKAAHQRRRPWLNGSNMPGLTGVEVSMERRNFILRKLALVVRDQGDIIIPGATEVVHNPNQIAIGDDFISADENRLRFIARHQCPYGVA